MVAVKAFICSFNVADIHDPVLEVHDMKEASL